MPSRSEKLSKKKNYTTPGGLRKTAYHNVKHAKHYCPGCGTELLGVPTLVRGKSRTEKAPNRPYGGIYCSSCSRKAIRHEVINRSGGIA